MAGHGLEGSFVVLRVCAWERQGESRGRHPCGKRCGPWGLVGAGNVHGYLLGVGEGCLKVLGKKTGGEAEVWNPPWGSSLRLSGEHRLGSRSGLTLNSHRKPQWSKGGR